MCMSPTGRNGKRATTVDAGSPAPSTHAADSKDEIIVWQRSAAVVAGDNAAVRRIVNPILPIPYRIQGIPDLGSDVRSLCQPRPARHCAEVEAHRHILHRHIAIALGKCPRKTIRHLGERFDGGLNCLGYLQPLFERVRFKKVEKRFVRIVLDVDGVTSECEAFIADIDPDENRISDDARRLAFADAIGGIEVQIGIGSRRLIAGVEIEQDAVHPVAGIVGHAHPIERNLHALAAQAGIWLEVAGMKNGQRCLGAGRMRRDVAECVSGIAPQPRPKQIIEQSTQTEAEDRALRQALQPRRYFGFADLAQHLRGICRRAPADHRNIVEQARRAARHDPAPIDLSFKAIISLSNSRDRSRPTWPPGPTFSHLRTASWAKTSASSNSPNFTRRRAISRQPTAASNRSPIWSASLMYSW